jgi:hypothetical protein
MRKCLGRTLEPSISRGAFKTTLATLLEEFSIVDLVDIDVQGHELVSYVRSQEAGRG